MNFPKTPGQCKYMLALRSPKPIVVGTGPAGTGKTMLACQVALEHVSKIQRPNIEDLDFYYIVNSHIGSPNLDI